MILYVFEKKNVSNVSKVSNAHQGCIYLIIVKYNLFLWWQSWISSIITPVFTHM